MPRVPVYTATFGGDSGGGDSPDVAGPAVYNDSGWSTTSLSQQLGWRFTVGSNDIVVTELRFYHGSGSKTETIRLWRHSDEMLLASKAVTAEDGWGKESVTPLTLSAGETYAVTHRDGGDTRTLYRDPTVDSAGTQIDAAITKDANVFSSDNGYPSSTTSAVYVGASFATEAPGSGLYRFYRLRITDNNGAADFVGTSSLEFATSNGGSDLAQSEGGQAYAFGVKNIVPSSAFDGSTTTGWADDPGNMPTWLAWDFGSANGQGPLSEYRVGAFSSSTDTNIRSASDWKLQASNDHETWEDLDAVTGETAWSHQELRTYTL